MISIARVNFVRIVPKINTFLNLHTSQVDLAGHSKWANIRHIKALKDGQKAALFTKFSRQIRVAIQEGGSSNPALNTALKNVVEEALKKKMPMATIQTAIKKSEQSKALLRKHILELRALNKIYMICILYTDNIAGLKMTLASIIRKAGAVVTDAAHLFDDIGLVETRVDSSKLAKKSEAELEELCTEDAIECGAEELEVVDVENGLVNFFCHPVEVDRVKSELSQKGYSIENAEHVFIPKIPISVPEKDLKAYELFVSKLKAFDAVEEIYDNLQHFEGD